MPTGDERVNLVLKRFLSQNRMGANFLEYLSDMTTDGLSRIFPHSGVFTYPVSCTFPSAGHFSLSPDPVEGIDNAGHVLIADTDYVTSIPYEEAAASKYWLGLAYCQISSGVYANPRTGIPEYDKLRDEIGIVSNPSSVTDAGGGTIQLNVNSVLQSSVDNSGRVVRVWLTDPLSSDPDVAFEDCTVTYSAPNNLITTTGSLGQSTITTSTSAYKVACLGVCVIKNATNPFTDSYIVLGYIDTTGSPSFTDADQIDLSGGGGHTLQRAYDGTGGSGSGRTISIAGTQAVLLTEQAASCYEDDIANAALRIKKDNTTSLPGVGFEKEGAIDIRSRFNSAANILVRVPIADYSGTDLLRIEETANIVAPNTINLTRGGVDLTLSGKYGFVLDEIDYVEIIGTTNNGVYFVDTPAATSFLAKKIDGSGAASLTNETGVVVRFYRPLLELASGPRVLRANLVTDFLHDYSGSSPSTIGQIHVYLPDGSRADEPVILVTNPTMGTLFQLNSTGFVQVERDVQINDALGNFRYQSYRSFTRIVPIANGEFGSGTWNLVASGGAYYVNGGSATSDYFIPVEIPDKARITNVRVIIYAGSGVDYTVNLLKNVQNFSSPPGSYTVIASDSGVGALSSVTHTLTPGTTEYVDRSIEEFVVQVIQVDAGSLHIEGVDVTFETLYLNH